MPLLLLMLLEITALIVVGNLIGVLFTLLLVVGSSVLGGFLLRREGSRAMAAMQEAMRHRRLPSDSADPTTIVVAILFLIPGLITTASGLLLLIPGSRTLVARRMRRSPRFVAQPGGPFAAQAGGGASPFGPRPGGPGGPIPRSGTTARGDVVEGEVIDGEVLSETIESEPRNADGPAGRPTGDPKPGDDRD
ncbi:MULTISPECIES: FxsA family protein [Actinoalloteichus]|uniref:FxsA cytoplasmic membrane protein n=1 Tax=Actinoalloteichus fjordicus TaxID=1612552 RepID=A0AAC9LB39_9PSEU|nr:MULTISPECIES: FxsA family protein [Actinoalloteichus]APU14658.1 FxsA cytoplasmic membrane protein [Actinoalloteichus fjordicus]APU20626.1 FxsA cytoplasmic membrane protein [Actinoalloteichus sp. GBA129-24]